MKRSRSINDLIAAISRLTPDRRQRSPRVWYSSQHEHWLGWLGQYDTPGAYGRKVTKGRDAKFAYNHIVEPKMLLYLIEAAGVDPELVQRAKSEGSAGTTMQSQSAAVRRVVPWDLVERALWHK